MQRILAAVDFSDCSRRALQTAFELSRGFEAALRVYVAPEIFRQFETSRSVLPVAPDASKLERELTDLILEEFKGTVDDFARIDKKIREGVEDVEILNEAESWQADLLVVGTHGRSGVGRLFLGSVSEKVVRRSTVPVLIVPDGAPAPTRRVLAAVAGDEAGEEILRAAEEWRKCFGAELSVLHVVDDRLEPALARVVPPEELLPRLQALREERISRIEMDLASTFPEEPRPALKVRQGRPFDEICAAAESQNADLLVIGPHDKSGVSELGSTASRVAHHSGSAVLVVRSVPKA